MQYKWVDEEDEGWMWLDWETLKKYQQEYNEMMNKLLDNISLVKGPQ